MREPVIGGTGVGRDRPDGRTVRSPQEPTAEEGLRLLEAFRAIACPVARARAIQIITGFAERGSLSA